MFKVLAPMILTFSLNTQVQVSVEDKGRLEEYLEGKIVTLKINPLARKPMAVGDCEYLPTRTLQYVFLKAPKGDSKLQLCMTDNVYRFNRLECGTAKIRVLSNDKPLNASK